MKLKSSERAKADLLSIRAYFDERNKAAGKKIAARIKQKLALLRKNPMGRIVDEKPGVYELVVDDYVLPYIIEDNTIVVLRVWHGARHAVRSVLPPPSAITAAALAAISYPAPLQHPRGQARERRRRRPCGRCSSIGAPVA